MKTATPILLEEYFFPIVQVGANPDGPEEAPDPQFNIKVTIGKAEEENLYQVTVAINTPDDEEETKQNYYVHLVAVGIFSVNPEFDNIPKLLHVTGSSMLYSAAREFLITITSRGPWDAVSLPTFSFLDQYNLMIEKEEQRKENIEASDSKTA